jgi:hypothetical protein
MSSHVRLDRLWAVYPISKHVTLHLTLVRATVMGSIEAEEKGDDGFCGSQIMFVVPPVDQTHVLGAKSADRWNEFRWQDTESWHARPSLSRVMQACVCGFALHRDLHQQHFQSDGPHFSTGRDAPHTS